MQENIDDNCGDISEEDLQDLTIVDEDHVDDILDVDDDDVVDAKSADGQLSVLEYLEQPEYAQDSIKEKCISRVIRESKIAFQHKEDVSQNILISWMTNKVKDGYEIQSVVSFACRIGQQACYSYMREMTGALNIPRRIVQEHKEQEKKLVTDVVDFAIVNENEVAENITNEACPLFKLPIQDSLFPLPRIDQHIERDINSGESMESVLARTGFEKRALQGRLINHTKADEEYVEMVHAELYEEYLSGGGNVLDDHPTLFPIAR